ncbi:MAG TPA: preprotein translocase subunit SecY, partial [Sulfuricurvum sp.]|nr:preprotein translocase subunit SecY [Sulfuricurvum sp.]
LGNGISFLIFAGIVAELPTSLSRFVSTWDPSQFFTYLLFLIVAIVTIVGVVFVNDGQRIIRYALPRPAYPTLRRRRPFRCNMR